MFLRNLISLFRLMAGYTYYFVVSDYNSAGLESLPSNQVSFTIPGPGQVDLVWENSTTGEHSIWILNNGVLSSTIGLPTISTEWHIVD